MEKTNSSKTPNNNQQKIKTMKKLQKTLFIFKDLMIANGFPGLLVLICTILLLSSGHLAFGGFMLGLLVARNQSFLKPLARKSRNTKSLRKKRK